jgi:hypothetical protein
MATIAESTARFAASLAAIEASKKKIVVIDRSTKKSVAGPVTKTITKAATTERRAPQKTTAASAGSERKSIVTSERAVKKTSKIGKLLKGKKYDFSK